MTRSFALLILVTAMLLCAQPSAPARGQSLVPLKLVAPATDSETSALYALHSGMFKRAGLDVQIVPMNSGAAVAAAVAGGAADVGLSSLVTIFSAHERGVPFVLVAPSAYASTTVPFAEFVVRKDDPIRSARELNGKTVASPGLRDFNALTIMAWIDQNGGDSRTVQFVELPQPATVEAIASGRIAGAVLGTPTLTSAVESGKVRVLGNSFAAIAPRYQYIAWFSTASFVEANREALTRFSRVMHDASVYCDRHPGETAPLVAQFAGVDPAMAARMVRVPFSEYLDARMIQPLIDAAAKYGVIEQPFDAATIISPVAARPSR
jgi:NitT/TauT family transport system substrate-binding protein